MANMDVNEFREFGKAAIDWVADYLENVRDREVLPSVEPGYLHEMIPSEIPEQGDHWKSIMEDFKRCILPGITHWQSPNFHAFYPSQTSYSSIVGETLAAGLGVVGFSWICSPACTELEVIMMNWLGQLLNLPKCFLNCDDGNGGGIIQGSASESIFVAVLVAREQAVRRLKVEHPELTESEIRGRMVAYTSDQSNSAVEKSGILGAIKMRLLPANDDCVLRGSTLIKAVEEDKANGLFPVIMVATLGTTGTCAYDKLEEIGPYCNENNIWLHIDAAYAGASFCLPEYAWIKKGLEAADSLNFNLHKWLFVNFDCCAMWFKDANRITDAFSVDRIYLQHKYQGQSKAPDYRHWQIQLGRRFRSLKVWVTLKTMGAEKIRELIRFHISLAQKLEAYAQADDRFGGDFFHPSTGVLPSQGEDALSKQLLENITKRKKIYMIPATFQGKFILRFMIGGIDPQPADIDYAWNEIKTQTDVLLGVDENGNDVSVKDIIKQEMFEKEKPIGKITESLNGLVLANEKAK
ncbi:hypothetical protein pipiens_005907 [Culex pipiens pipiens]|uniref:Uncharacterized protein n=1 Tax=Culex pipiens pipiens TaxID=38569 RepID=A0ABD1DSS7_CULPP